MSQLIPVKSEHCCCDLPPRTYQQAALHEEDKRKAADVIEEA